VAVASAGPYANLHLDSDTTMPASHHSFFSGWMPFLPPNQQHQSTEDKFNDKKIKIKRPFNTANH